MDDLISRQQAIDVLHGYFDGMLETDTVCPADIYGLFECMPSMQPKQNEMIKEIRRWINSGNRGNADYFIVDRIEEIINKYE